MKKGYIITGVVIVILVIAGIWIYVAQNKSSYVAPSNSQPAPQPTAAPTTGTSELPPPPPAAPTLMAINMATNPALGDYLTGANGMTLYAYSKDTPGVSNCTGTCATNWPPYTVSTSVGLTGVATTTGAIGTITRADGTMQITYNNIPLYFWSKDAKVGDTTGQNVGGTWQVVKP